MSYRLAVCCFLWGEWGGDDPFLYVKNLYNMIERNTTYDFDFYCFTDRMLPETKHIKYAEIPRYVVAWPFNLTKMYIHKDLPWLKNRRVILFDLDMLIVENIDEMLSYDGPFCGIEPFSPRRAGKHIGGGFLSFVGGITTPIWKEVSENSIHYGTMSNGGKERLVLKHFADLYDWNDRWQLLYPRQVVSFKKHCKRKYLPYKAKIIAFHGQPKIHNSLNRKLINEYWK